MCSSILVRSQLFSSLSRPSFNSALLPYRSPPTSTRMYARGKNAVADPIDDDLWGIENLRDIGAVQSESLRSKALGLHSLTEPCQYHVLDRFACPCILIPSQSFANYSSMHYVPEFLHLRPLAMTAVFFLFCHAARNLSLLCVRNHVLMLFFIISCLRVAS